MHSFHFRTRKLDPGPRAPLSEGRLRSAKSGQPTALDSGLRSRPLPFKHP